MYEKVNPCHPDKIADRIAGAIVDLAYKNDTNPRIAVEVLIGHGKCHVIAETSTQLNVTEVNSIIERIAGNVDIDFVEVPQDIHLAENQKGTIRCGDNGIFKGVPLTIEQKKLSSIARELFDKYGSDGKYILDGTRLIICQSNANSEELRRIYPDADINPIGDWTGGTDVDSGATNRKLGSDMADSVTGVYDVDTNTFDITSSLISHSDWTTTKELLEFTAIPSVAITMDVFSILLEQEIGIPLG